MKHIIENQECQKVEEEFKKELSVCDYYFEWLKDFTDKYVAFSDNSWEYCPWQITEEDNINVNKIGLLFKMVDSYAMINLIPHNTCEAGKYYLLEVKDIYYKLSVVAYKDIVFSCEKVELEKGERFIRFCDLNTQKSDQFIKIRLEDLKNFIKELTESGIPLSVIKECVEKLQ